MEIQLFHYKWVCKIIFESGFNNMKECRRPQIWQVSKRIPCNSVAGWRKELQLYTLAERDCSLTQLFDFLSVLFVCPPWLSIRYKYPEQAKTYLSLKQCELLTYFFNVEPAYELEDLKGWRFLYDVMENVFCWKQ